MDELNDQQKELYEQERERLVKIIEAFDSLSKTEEWAVLNELIFTKSKDGIERLILNESLAPEIDVNKLYKLQGEWVWARNYSDVSRFVETLKKQLSDIKSKLK